MLHRLWSLVFWTFLVLSCLSMFPIAVVIWGLTLFDERKRALHQFTCFWASLYTWLNPVWRVRVVGREKIRSDETYVMVANHNSLLDILVMFRLFVHFKWVSKVENFRVPVVGWNMRLNQYIEIKRGNSKSVIQMLRACRAALAANNSIMMFPEGTRSNDGRLRKFRGGAFELAKSAQRPILPITVEGTGPALPKNGFVLQGRHNIRITVLDEIPFEEFAETPVEQLSLDVRNIFVERLGIQEKKAATAVNPEIS